MSPIKAVSFQGIEVRQYAITLGDHPNCRIGPPLTLGWEHISSTVSTVDVYEEERRRTRKRSIRRVLVSPADRNRLLRKGAGITSEQIDQACKEVQRISKQRKRTKSFRRWDPIEECFESAKRKITRSFGRKDELHR